jgi:transcriptional regulator with XRE-family HTH domain
MRKKSQDVTAREYVRAAKLAVVAMMDQHGLTQTDVARITGRSQAAVSRWLDPESPQFFDLHHYARLCIHLKIPPAVVLPPADWTEGRHQELLKYLIKLPVADLAFALSVHQLAVDTYGQNKAPAMRGLVEGGAG